MNDRKEKHAHTPGPWHVRPGEDYYHVHGEVRVALVENWIVEDPKANARLIAAAPEMHQLLREILLEYEAEAKAEGWDLPTSGEMIREVLAKVEGGEG